MTTAWHLDYRCYKTWQYEAYHFEYERFLELYHWYCPWNYYPYKNYLGNAFEHWYR